jgi:hypothetical protein
MSYNCCPVGSSTVALVKMKLSAQGLEGCQASGSPTMQFGSQTLDHPPGVPVLKVCYCSHRPRCVELDQAFDLNRGILGIRYWVGLCINRNGPLLEGLCFGSD